MRGGKAQDAFILNFLSMSNKTTDSETPVECVENSTPLNIYQAMAAILAEIKPVAKSRNADLGAGGKYKFRGIDDMYNALHEAFAKYKVFLLPEILDEKSEIIEKEKNFDGKKTITYSKYTTLKVKYTFIACDGTSVSSIGIGEAIDTSDKATNKAQSSALKYVLMQVFLIPTEEPKDVETEDNEIDKLKVIPNKKTAQGNAELAYPELFKAITESQNPGQFDDLARQLFKIQNDDENRKELWFKLANHAKKYGFEYSKETKQFFKITD
jgi:hypothetical protein